MSSTDHSKTPTLMTQKPEEAVALLKNRGITKGLFTNGIFAFPTDHSVATLLTGFQYLVDREDITSSTPLFIAVNSDKSLATINEEKELLGEEKIICAPQAERALSVASPLAMLFPSRPVIVLFFDEETPKELYESLLLAGLDMKMIFKWSYALDANAPMIVGADNFEHAFAFPLPDGTLPSCANLTATQDQSSFVHVLDLCAERGRYGGHYISVNSECLFPLPPEIKRYGVLAQRKDKHAHAH